MYVPGCRPVRVVVKDDTLGQRVETGWILPSPPPKHRALAGLVGVPGVLLTDVDLTKVDVEKSWGREIAMRFIPAGVIQAITFTVAVDEIDD